MINYQFAVSFYYIHSYIQSTLLFHVSMFCKFLANFFFLILLMRQSKGIVNASTLKSFARIKIHHLLAVFQFNLYFGQGPYIIGSANHNTSILTQIKNQTFPPAALIILRPVVRVFRPMQPTSMLQCRIILMIINYGTVFQRNRNNRVDLKSTLC